jgi:poly-D-alanine transfer protein DltD
MKKKFVFGALLAAMLLTSMAIVPAVSAQADISQNKEHADAIYI